MEELYHQTGKAFEGSRYPDGRTDFDENTLGRVNVDLQLPSFVDGGVE